MSDADDLKREQAKFEREWEKFKKQDAYGFQLNEVVFFEPSYVSNEEEWSKKCPMHPLNYGDRVYYLGEIPNVPGHCLVFKRGAGVVDMIHPGDLRKAKEEEL